MIFGVQWYLWLLLLAAAVLAVFMWIKAVRSSRERRERLKKEAEIWKRDYELRQDFAVLTREKILSSEENRLLAGAAMNIQIKLENAGDMNGTFVSLEEEKKNVYALEYFIEDAETSLSAFFKNNGSPLTDSVPSALKAIGETEILKIYKKIAPMYDPDSEVSVNYDEIGKADEEFAESFDPERLKKSAADYIKNNIDIFFDKE